MHVLINIHLKHKTFESESVFCPALSFDSFSSHGKDLTYLIGTRTH